MIRLFQLVDAMGLPHCICDEDGLFCGRLYPLDHSRLVYGISYLSLGSIAYIIYKKQWKILIVPASICITSLLYWRDPLFKSPYRYLDMVTVSSMISYQIWQSRRAQYRSLYYGCMLSGISCYFVSNALLPVHTGLSILFHAGLHIFGNLSNIVLASGYLEPQILEPPL